MLQKGLTRRRQGSERGKGKMNREDCKRKEGERRKIRKQGKDMTEKGNKIEEEGKRGDQPKEEGRTRRNERREEREGHGYKSKERKNEGTRSKLKRETEGKTKRGQREVM